MSYYYYHVFTIFIALYITYTCTIACLQKIFSGPFFYRRVLVKLGQISVAGNIEIWMFRGTSLSGHWSEVVWPSFHHDDHRQQNQKIRSGCAKYFNIHVYLNITHNKHFFSVRQHGKHHHGGKSYVQRSFCACREKFHFPLFSPFVIPTTSHIHAHQPHTLHRSHPYTNTLIDVQLCKSSNLFISLALARYTVYTQSQLVFLFIWLIITMFLFTWQGMTLSKGIAYIFFMLFARLFLVCLKLIWC